MPGGRRARRAIVGTLIACGAAGAPAPAAVPGFAPPAHSDPAEHAGDPLDLRAAAFGQVGAQLSVVLRVRGSWPRAPLAGDPLCVTLVRRGRLCVAGEPRRLRIAYRGRVVRGSEVERRGGVVRVLVYPRALGLRPGRLRWFASSRLNEGDADRLPDTGTLAARVGVYGAPRCFGAAARARRGRPCVNRALRRSVVPAPGRAALMPDFPCDRTRGARRYAPALPCAFGATYAASKPRLALIGDSHTAHLRATTEVAAQALGWRAVSMTHPGCAFSTEVYPAPAPIPARCRRHSEQALRWLRGHPSVRVLVTSASAGRGLGAGGFRAMFSRVPRSVRRIYVVRDVPRVGYGTAACVARVLVDFTRLFCDSAHCFPVIGGAYAYRDFNHLNPVFAATLGPYLLRALR